MMNREEVLSKIFTDLKDKRDAAHKLAMDYALAAIEGKIEDKAMNEDTARRYLVRREILKEAMSSVDYYINGPGRAE
jgi:hypothetical protein